MMGRREVPMTDGIELEALTKWKKYYNWNPGVRKYIKRKFLHRERMYVKQVLIPQELIEYLKS